MDATNNQADLTTLAPPPTANLDDKESLIFWEVTEEVRGSEITEHTARLCASLAKDLAALERETSALRREGSVFTKPGGNCSANPRINVVSKLHGSVIGWRRSLGIHAIPHNKRGEVRHG